MKKTKIIMLFCMVVVLIAGAVLPICAELQTNIPTTNDSFIGMLDAYAVDGFAGCWESLSNNIKISNKGIYNDLMGAVNINMGTATSTVTSMSTQFIKANTLYDGAPVQFIIPNCSFAVDFRHQDVGYSGVGLGSVYAYNGGQKYSAFFQITQESNIRDVRIIVRKHDNWNSPLYPIQRFIIEGYIKPDEPTKIYWEEFSYWKNTTDEYAGATNTYALDTNDWWELSLTIAYSRESNSDKTYDRQRSGLAMIGGATWSQSTYKDFNAWRVAVNQGYTYGYNGGYIIGKNQGYTEGEQIGYDNGYQQGTIDGVMENENAFLNMVTAIFTAPATFIDSIFGFEIFDINLAGFIKTLLTLCIVGAIVLFVWRAVR